MTESDEKDFQAQPTPPADLPTAGAMLRAAREASGLHVAALAVSLKVPPRKLEALEADRHEGLGDSVFVRALAASVCRSLKVDPKPILDRLPANAAPSLRVAGGAIYAPIPSTGGVKGSKSFVGLLARPSLAAALVLGLAAALILFLPPISTITQALGIDSVFKSGPQAELPGFPPGTPATQVESAASSAPGPGTPSGLASPESRPGGGGVEVAAPAIVASALAHGSAPTPISPAPSEPGVVSASPAASGGLVIRVRDRSWVDVSSGSGASLLRRTLSDETVDLPLAGNVRVTIGNASGASVTVRGRAVDLAAVTRDNVVRLEIK